ncbi:putative anti-sigma factor antagonist [Hartmannibacter diazotrophicus]|uniref:Putative anti-sigma factor antagonist n=1 Tax=Hartmannibacter diazotrophicus TaxID=1482074 RepID=A0A2C9DDE3_9HYPH|nr:STAS domain-containing protein [Hartmannibacter diazotrophicus]SON58263.1 putative anti-sigma factor antagonist [Hartmannibacter diazotrophicus]
MDLQTTKGSDGFVAKLSGKMMFSDNVAFRLLLQDVRACGAPCCVFDVSELTSIDSAGLGMLVIAAEAAKSQGWEMVVRKPEGQVKQLLALARFDKLMTIRD